MNKPTRPHRITCRIDDLTLRQINRLIEDWPDTFKSSADVISCAVNALSMKRSELMLQRMADLSARLSQVSDI